MTGVPALIYLKKSNRSGMYKYLEYLSLCSSFRDLMYADVELLLMNALVMPRWGHGIAMYPAALIMDIMHLSAIL